MEGGREEDRERDRDKERKRQTDIHGDERGGTLF